MSPIKSEGSSCRKGKEPVVENPPPEGEGDEEATPSKLSHSKAEGVARDPNSECPPFLDSWYDTHSYFLVVADDYTPHSLNRVWLSLE